VGIVAAALSLGLPGQAADRTVSVEMFDRIVAELNARPDVPPRIEAGQAIANSDEAAACDMAPTDVILTVPELTGRRDGVSLYQTREERLSILATSPAPATGSIVARPKGLSVDLDGSPRAYHPLDPYGACPQEGRGGKPCALDWLCNAGVRLFSGGNEIGCRDKDAYAAAWSSMWSEISSSRAVAVPSADWQRDVSGRSAPRYGFFHSARPLAVVMSTAILPKDESGKPCVRTGEADGYFVSATSLTWTGVGGTVCAPDRYLNAAEIPAVIVPKGGFAGAAIGDVAVGHIREVEGRERLAFGIVGDLGPNHRFGEGTLAFNAALLGIEPREWKGAHEINRETDIGASKGRITILIIKSAGHITTVPTAAALRQRAAAAFAAWGRGSEAAARKRLAACSALLE
jgi:hypothetical protein